MKKFVQIGDEYLNTDYIISVSAPQPDGTMFIELSDGRTLTRPASCLNKLVGESAPPQLNAPENR